MEKVGGSMRRHLFVGTFLFFITLVSGCGWMYQLGASEEEAGKDVTEANMYVQPFSYTNQDNETVTNEDLKGKYWLANMVFTRCPTVCNLMTPNMLNMQGKAAEEGLDIQFVSFTVDPEFDDPEQLKIYGENYGADFSNWHFLTGYSFEEIKQFSEESFRSIVEKAPEQEDIIHATSFFLVDPNGQVIRSFDGTNNDTDPFIEEIKELMNE